VRAKIDRSVGLQFPAPSVFSALPGETAVSTVGKRQRGFGPRNKTLATNTKCKYLLA
jgi:hypothetical protein